MNYELPSGWITHNSRLKTHNSFVLCGAKKLSFINYHLSFKTMENKDLWSKILNIVITVLTAIATTFGVSSCM